MSADFDSPWKEALDTYFDRFVALLFPAVHAEIDWSRGYESLDKEFQQIVRDAEVGRRYVDKLVKVFTTGGAEQWVLIHIEVQTEREAEFPRRVYVYNYRIFDKYDRPVASLVVLADDEPGWRPAEFHSRLFGCESGIRFPAVKLLDFAPQEAELEASSNPFAKVVLAHLKARETHDDPANRHVWKVRLVRGLYERGFTARDVRELFRLIDWLMELPPALEERFGEEIERMQEEKRMPYVTSIERVALRRGLREGIEAMLELRFGEEGLKYMPEIQAIHEEEKLRVILRAARTADKLEDVRQLITPGP